jgi:hypothetical protein
VNAATVGTVLAFMVPKNSRPAVARVLYRLSVADAKVLCSDPRTAFRNSALHYSCCLGHEGRDWKFVPDGGRFDKLLAELGVTVLEDLGHRLEGT